MLQRHQHECSVIQIGIKIITKFKSPAPRRSAGVLDLPIAGVKNLFVEKKFCSFSQSVIARGLCLDQCKCGNSRVPDRRQASLQPYRIRFFDLESAELLDL